MVDKIPSVDTEPVLVMKTCGGSGGEKRTSRYQMATDRRHEGSVLFFFYLDQWEYEDQDKTISWRICGDLLIPPPH